MDPPVGQKTQY